jgi:SAM-dependent methyltransferase
MHESFLDINSAKANFDEIYAMEDPRSYFSVLGSLDYMIPDVAQPVIRQILEAHAERHAREALVLDVGSSYGINAAVHRFPVTFNVLRRRYTRREVAALDTEEMLRLDRNYYSSWPDSGCARFVGLDMSAPAIRYAERVGLIEHGITADLETSRLAPRDAHILSDIDVVLSTGSVGYVTERTFETVLSATRRPPWIVSFVLRMFPYDQLSALFREHGLITERLSTASFDQRRFQNDGDLEGCLATLTRLGIDTHGFETDGLLRAELFLSRPPADVAAAPLHEIVTVSSGRHRAVGPRYVQICTGERQVALEP